jgi:RNA polymerase sigma factor (sigma-70 family)
MTEGPERDAFCAALGPRLVGSLLLYCGDRGLAEELAQEALVRTVERWPQVAAMTAPEAWVYRVAFNLARSRFRRRGAERRATRRLARLPVPSADDETTAIAVRAAVRALPPRQRAVVIARFYSGLSVAETATALACAEGTVKATTHQAIRALRAAGIVDEEEVTVDDTVG